MRLASKESLKILIKFLIAGVIIYWLISSGKLDFSLVKKALAENRWPFTLLLLLAQIPLAAYRWKLLIQLNTKAPVSFSKVYGLTWIGLFFNSFLPGAVTGDFVKVYYAKKIDASLTKTYLLLTAFMDRFLGLIGLLILMGFFSAIQFTDLTERSIQLRSLVQFNLLLFLGACGILLTIFLKKKWQLMIIGLVKKIPVLGEKLATAFEQLWMLGSKPKVVFLSVLISIIGQTLHILAFWNLTSSFYGVDLHLTQALTFIPLGMIAVAIPITPAGIGVGHAAFDTLFSFYGIKGGASLFNLHFLAVVIINSLGFIPFMFSGKRPNFDEMEEEK
ncbi:MAG: lysylphosphatidylglycerol synthase transmembrane domain-containing protein [Bacteriovoracaceae bacterium]